MPKEIYSEVIFTGPRASLERVRKCLAVVGIDCRISTPRRAHGFARVCLDDAVRAREVLRNLPTRGRVIEAPEATAFRCPHCDALLSLGAKQCQACGAPLVDPHAR